MRSITYLIGGALALFSLHLQASEPASLPLHYNSPGLESEAQKTITERSADVVAKQYLDLDQDQVPDKLDHCPNTIIGVKVDKHGCELDSDQDGVFDRLDQCPDSAPGAKVNMFGCEGDEDFDGVLDSKDECPGTPEGTPVDERGCTQILDSDQDGVMDPEDQCPETQPGVTVNQHGCEPVQRVLTNIIFDSNEHAIRDDQADILKRDAAALSNLEENQVILITGHTDWQASQAFNLRLSWRRANSTKQFIVEQLNRNAEQIYINGKGEMQPIADNQTAEGRQENRRIELNVIDINELPPEAQRELPDEMKPF